MKGWLKLALFALVLMPLALIEGGADASQREKRLGAALAPAFTEGLLSNTFLGTNAGANTAGDDDEATFIGWSAGAANTIGENNTFVGHQSGLNNLLGHDNTFLGTSSGRDNTANQNTFLGAFAGMINSTGPSNTFVGYQSGGNNSTASHNTFVGWRAGLANGTGSSNTTVGSSAGIANTTGNNNMFAGQGAGSANTTGGDNTFVGQSAGPSNTTGVSNTFVGRFAGSANITGIQNTYLGWGTGGQNSVGSGNIFLGFRAGLNEQGSNKLYVDNSDDTTPLIHGDFGTDVLTVNGNLTAIGPDSGLVRLADNTTAATAKASRMVLLDHVDAANTPNYLFGAFNDATNHFVALGGGAPVANAATQFDIFTAPVKGTAGGTARFTVLGNGNIGLGNQGAAHPLHAGPQANNAFLSAAGVWTNGSSRAYKRDFRDIDPRAILDKVAALPVQSWASNNEADSVRHLGPTAEDFFAAFGLGGDDKSIGTVDADGVALAAIKGLVEVGREKDRELTEQKARIKALEEEQSQLKARLAALERLLMKD